MIINNNKTQFNNPTGMRIHQGNDRWDFDFYPNETLILNWNDNNNVIFYNGGNVYTRGRLDADNINSRRYIIAEDYIYSKKRLISDGNIEVWGGKAITRRGWASNNSLNFTNFTSYNFDDPLKNVTGSWSGHLVVDDHLKVSDNLHFGSSTRQMINLWSNSFGIGIQSSTQYYRSAKNFAWFRGGSHNDSEKHAGGGTLDMILSDGNLGLGLSDPAARLDIVGEAMADHFTVKSGIIRNDHLIIRNDRITADGHATQAKALILEDKDALKVSVGNFNPNDLELHIEDERLMINADATVLNTHITGKPDGIVYFEDGVYVGSEQGLIVKHQIRTKDINVTPNDDNIVPDYVFEDSYDLPPLSEVDQYIRKNKHLPGVPSAKDIAAGGYNLTSMDFVLLRKVEELTLYLLEMKEENAALKKEVGLLKKKH